MRFGERLRCSVKKQTRFTAISAQEIIDLLRGVLYPELATSMSVPSSALAAVELALVLSLSACTGNQQAAQTPNRYGYGGAQWNAMIQQPKRNNSPAAAASPHSSDFADESASEEDVADIAGILASGLQQNPSGMLDHVSNFIERDMARQSGGTQSAATQSPTAGQARSVSGFGPNPGYTTAPTSSPRLLPDDGTIRRQYENAAIACDWAAGEYAKQGKHQDAAIQRQEAAKHRQRAAELNDPSAIPVLDPAIWQGP